MLRADSTGDIAWTNGNWHLRFTGFDNYPYAVESSTNLVSWSCVSTNYPTNGVFSFPISLDEREFFRSRLLP